MALSELLAFESAYQVLSPLDGAARRRALHWLADALGQGAALAVNAAETDPAAEPEEAPVSGRGRKARAAKVTGRAKKRPAANGRAYRRMPDAGEVMSAYQEIGTVSGLAEHFDVPVYTVHSWARRLRGQGYQIGREK